MSKKIVITETTGVATGLNYIEMVDLMCAYITSCAQRQTTGLSEEDIEAIFNDTNMAFSKCLENAFPTITLREDITEAAIMDAENKLLEEKTQGRTIDVAEARATREESKQALVK